MSVVPISSQPHPTAGDIARALEKSACPKEATISVHKVANAAEAGHLAVQEAMIANAQQTFSVGGIMVETSTGKVLAVMHNNVLKPYPNSQANPPYVIYDPTAHGERQLIDWYFANRTTLKLPPPEECTIITSLDPCAMCAGSLLTAKFKVGVVALDNWAGVNIAGSFTFPCMVPHLRKEAQAHWGYYGWTAPLLKAYVGAATPFGHGQSIDSVVGKLGETIIQSNMAQVQQSIINSGLPPSQLTINPKTLAPNDPIRLALTELWKDTLTIVSANYRQPGVELAQPLLTAAATPSAGNALAFIDPFGNLLCCLPGVIDLSPIRTCFMEVIRKYTLLRWLLLNSSDADVRKRTEQCLTHPRYGTFVFLNIPNPHTPETLMTLGAYGTSLQTPAEPYHFQFVLQSNPQEVTELQKVIDSMPPMYGTLKIHPDQVQSQALIEACKPKH